MSNLNQVEFNLESNDLFTNPESRCLCVLLLDVSMSMNGKPIEELNNGLKTFKDNLIQDELAAKRVEISIVTFGPVEVNTTFTNPYLFEAPVLSPQGNTPMGEAIFKGIELIKQRKKEYRENGISYYKPWIFLITDGAPTDEWKAAAEAIQKGEKEKAFTFFPIAIQGANMEILKQLSSVRVPIMLNGLKFNELFLWLSSSLQAVSHSNTTEIVNLQSPAGWGTV